MLNQIKKTTLVTLAALTLVGAIGTQANAMSVQAFTPAATVKAGQALFDNDIVFEETGFRGRGFSSRRGFKSNRGFRNRGFVSSKFKHGKLGYSHKFGHNDFGHSGFGNGGFSNSKSFSNKRGSSLKIKKLKGGF